VQGGNVWLVAGDYVLDLLHEMEVFPIGSHDDQVAAAAIVLARNGGNFKEFRSGF
jgi:phage terminase large subunit-like protein